MWCEKCHYGNANYNFNHCGHCGHTKLTSKNPFTENKKNKNAKKKQDDTEENDQSSIHNDIEDIVEGKVKPTIMR